MRLAAAARALQAASSASAPFSLVFLTDRRRIANPEPILRTLPKGAAVIFRDDDAPGREAMARRYLSICRARGVFFLVAGDEALAVRIGADGAHRRSCGAWGRRAPDPRFIITAACHSEAEIARAHRLGARLALLSPAFPTQSHPGAEHLGPARFRRLAAASPVPVIALGGVDENNAAGLSGRNVAGLGAIAAFCSA